MSRIVVALLLGACGTSEPSVVEHRSVHEHIPLGVGMGLIAVVRDETRGVTCYACAGGCEGIWCMRDTDAGR